MIYLNKDAKLTTDLLQKIINKFIMNVQPQLQKWKNYYDGKHVILNKSYADNRPSQQYLRQKSKEACR